MAGGGGGGVLPSPGAGSERASLCKRGRHSGGLIDNEP